MKRKAVLSYSGHGHILSLAISLFIVLHLPPYMQPGVGHAQVVTSITPTTPGADGLGTTVTQTGNIYNITGGTRPGNETNLFHSFGDFSVGTLDIARFQNTTPTLATSNILARVTGGSPSSLFGTVDTLSYGGANLFLMNPAGIVFGPNVTLNVGGSVAFTTANYLRMTDGALFNGLPGPANALLSSAPVAAFGFLGSNPRAITVQGSHLSVFPGQSLSFVGGNITIESGTLGDGTIHAARLVAPGGQINLASVASPGEVLHGTLQSGPNINGDSFTVMGNINLSQGATLDVSNDAAGTIVIRGGQLVIADTTLSSDTDNANGSPTAVDIQVTGHMSIPDTRGTAAITARSTGSGDAGEVRIQSGNLDATSTSKPLFALIDSHTTGSGKSGDIGITTTNGLNVTGTPTGQMYFIDSGTIGPGSGHGGNIIMTAGNIGLKHTQINSGDFIARSLSQEAGGSGGNVTITADTLLMSHALIATDGYFVGRAGDLTIHARDIQLNNFSQFSLLEFEGGGALRITADRLIANSTQFESETVFGPGGGITIAARVVELKNGTTLRSQTVGDGNAGDIRITATDHLTLTDRFIDLDPHDLDTLGPYVRPTGLFTNSLGNADLGDLGSAGSIIITTPQLEITGGARINSTTQSSGRGGDVIITPTNHVTISGERPTEVIEEGLFGLGSTRASGIYTRTVGSEFCSGPCGNAGNVTIMTPSMNLSSGAVIDSGTTSNGRGGNITVTASNQIAVSGAWSVGEPTGIFSRTIGTTPAAGSGGNISLTAGQSVTISDDASISASSTGSGNTGNISINAGQQFEMRDSSITAKADHASGGNIDIRAVDRIRLVNSTISSSVQGDASTAGGNITIDPNVVVLQNSQVTAEAVQGAGGNITIFTPLYLADSSSLVSASSQRGVNGTVTIQNPTSNLSETLGTLPSEAGQAQTLLTQRCAALASGQASSFVVAGREQLPADPGGWLTSPFAFAVLGENHDAGYAVASTPASITMATHDPAIVSLRRLTPTGFLMAHFADSETNGCHS